MGLMKDFLITIHNGGDEAVAAVQRMGEDWRAMLEQAASEIERRWIPVTERMPDGDGIVLLHAAHDSDKWITMGYRSGDGWYVIEAAEALWHHDLNRFTHWMPLPAVPTDAK